MVSTAVPVLAEPAPQEPSPEQIQAAFDLGDKSPPDAADIAEGLRRLEEEEAARTQWLQSPEAEQERQESLHEFADATPFEAAGLLDSLFAEKLALIDQDPARALSDAKLEQVLGETGARITVEGKTLLMEGTLPVRAPDEDGEKRKVDLDLVPEGEDFVPANPIVEVDLPDSASEPIAVGSEGLAIAPVLTEPAGESRLLDGEDVLYHETQEATDTIAAPLGAGIELFSLLRSAASPEEIRYELTLPEGAELRPDGRGGFEVLREEEPLASIPAPTAIDAQGTDIPVTMHVEDSELVIEIRHRSMDLSYPVLLDPAIWENWYDNYNDWYHYGNFWALGHWYPGTNDPGRFQMKTEPINAAPGLSNRGLFVAASPFGAWQPSERFGQYTYTAPGSDTYFYEVSIKPLWRWDQGCGYKTYPQPHDYTGLWNATWGWATVPLHMNWARIYEYGILFPSEELKYPDTWREKTGNVVVIGLGTGASGGPAISCTRDLYAGGVSLWMDDWYTPSIGAVSGLPGDEWLGAEKHSIEVPAGDAGLGVRFVTMTIDGGTVIKASNLPACTGLRASLCPADITAQFDPSGLSFPEGIRGASVQAEDPTGKVSETAKFQLKVDRSGPGVTLSGQLAEATKEVGSEEPPTKEDKAEPLSLPVYNLLIKATDGSTGSNVDKRSGVKDIKIFLDKEAKTVPWKPLSECPLTSCKMEVTIHSY